HRLALDLAVQHRLPPGEELLGRGEVAGDLDGARLLAARTEPGHALVAVVVLDHFVLVLEALDRVNAADGDAVDLDGEPVGEVEVALRLGAALQAVTCPLHCHAASPGLRPPSRSLCALLSGRNVRGFRYYTLPRIPAARWDAGAREGPGHPGVPCYLA